MTNKILTPSELLTKAALLRAQAHKIEQQAKLQRSISAEDGLLDQIKELVSNESRLKKELSAAEANPEHLIGCLSEIVDTARIVTKTAGKARTQIALHVKRTNAAKEKAAAAASGTEASAPEVAAAADAPDAASGDSVGGKAADDAEAAQTEAAAEDANTDTAAVSDDTASEGTVTEDAETDGPPISPRHPSASGRTVPDLPESEVPAVREQPDSGGGSEPDVERSGADKRRDMLENLIVSDEVEPAARVAAILALHGAMSPQEVTELSMDDTFVDTDAAAVLKNDKSAEVPLGLWEEFAGGRSDGPLFVREDGRTPMTASDIGTIVTSALNTLSRSS